MAEGLTQQQIDELLGNIQRGAVDLDGMESQDKLAIKDYDFRSPRRISRDQVRFLENIYDNFARFFGMQLTSMLRVGCDVEIVGIEEQEYKEFNNALADSVLVGQFDLDAEAFSSEDNQIIIEMSRQLAFTMIDLLLGGDGSGYEYTREYTDIELQIMQYVFKMMQTHLNNAWSNYIDLKHNFSMTETNSRVVQFLKPDDAMALVTLKMTIKDVEGSINICVPIDSLEVLYPLFDIRGNKSKFKDEAKFEMQREMMFSSIKRSSLEIKGVLGTTELALADLLQLQKGDILILNDRPMDISPHIVIEDEKWFSADMGVHKKQYALQIKNRLK